MAFPNQMDTVFQPTYLPNQQMSQILDTYLKPKEYFISTLHFRFKITINRPEILAINRSKNKK